MLSTALYAIFDSLPFNLNEPYLLPAFLVRTPTTRVSRTGELGIKLGQYLFQDKADVFTNCAFCHTAL
jgi:hypothetical protein